MVPRSVCILLGAGKPDSAGVSETGGHSLWVCNSDIGSRVCRVLRRDRSPQGSVCLCRSDIAEVLRVCGAVPDRVA